MFPKIGAPNIGPQMRQPFQFVCVRRQEPSDLGPLPICVTSIVLKVNAQGWIQTLGNGGVTYVYLGGYNAWKSLRDKDTEAASPK